MAGIISGSATVLVLVTVIIVCGLAFIVIRRRHGTLTRGIVFAYLVLLWASVALFVFVEHKYLVGVIVLVFPTMISWAAVFPGIDHAQRVSGKRILLTHSEVKDLETVKAVEDCQPNWSRALGRGHHYCPGDVHHASDRDSISRDGSIAHSHCPCVSRNCSDAPWQTETKELSS
jgi:hypothetical protein